MKRGTELLIVYRLAKIIGLISIIVFVYCLYKTLNIKFYDVDCF